MTPQQMTPRAALPILPPTPTPSKTDQSVGTESGDLAQMTAQYEHLKKKLMFHGI